MDNYQPDYVLGIGSWGFIADNTPLVLESMSDDSKREHWASLDDLANLKGDTKTISYLMTTASGLIRYQEQKLDMTGDVKSYEEYLEDIAILNASKEVKSKFKLSVPPTMEEIQSYRKGILDHQETRHRIVFKHWRRDPNSKNYLTPQNSKPGKMAGNGTEIWGSSLLDLYTVYRKPMLKYLLTMSSGSQLAAWVKSQGELYAEDELFQAEREESPKLILPRDVGSLIKHAENLIREEITSKAKDGSRKWEIPETWPPASPFDPNAYPPSWPREPFLHGSQYIPTLQHYILLSDLPAKLVVHDPWQLLKATRKRRPPYDFDEEMEEVQQDWSWTSTEDITHIYRLESSEDSVRQNIDLSEANINLLKKQYDRLAFLEDPHTKHRDKFPEGYLLHDKANLKAGPAKPPIFIVLPLRENRKQAPEAHLYISPVEKIGMGNHSFVYRAEWELPRNQLVDDEICETCILEDLHEILAQEDGEYRERRDPKWDELSGKYVQIADEHSGMATEMNDPITGKKNTYLLSEGKWETGLRYEGPLRAIESRVKYQDLAAGPYCKHMKVPAAVHPLTSKVYVAAKLSIQGDHHLANEFKNYKKFPRHFFQHWSGFNIVEPSYNPVPVGPLVPQFYGYYVIDEQEETRLTKEREDKKKSMIPNDDKHGESATSSRDKSTVYWSPILLIEDCGHPVIASDLSVDDRTQCASLIYRFHEEGWIHGSAAQRNIVRQPGPLSAWPSEREANTKKRGGLGKQWDYRLIDFGRSVMGRHNLDFIEEKSNMTGWIFNYGTPIKP